MDYIKVLNKYYGDKGWTCGNSYESLIWSNEFGEKPTDEHLKHLWDDMQEDLMRKERNRLLEQSDFRALPDYPQRDIWIIYRQALRDFPEKWVIGLSFPELPKIN